MSLTSMTESSTTEWNGKTTNAFKDSDSIECHYKLDDIKNMKVLIHGIKAKNVGNFSGTIIDIQLNSDDPIKQLYSSSKVILEQLTKVETANMFPIVARIKKVKNYFTLSDPDKS